MLIHKDLSLQTLLTIDPIELTQQRSEDATIVYRTEFGEASLEILNLFPPVGRAFWSFGLFSSQEQHMNSFLNVVQNDVLDILNRMIIRLGVERQSINTYEFLAPLCKPMGDEYYPYSESNLPLPYWWFAQRHLACVCPAGESKPYIDYFSDQEIQIGSDCYIQASDDLVLVDQSQYKSAMEYEYLTAYVGALSTTQLVLAETALSNEAFVLEADQGILRVVGRSGGPNVTLIEEVAAFSNAEQIRRILCLRVEVALKFSTLIDIERMRNSLDDFWHPADRVEMLKKIEDHLSRFPVIGSTS